MTPALVLLGAIVGGGVIGVGIMFLNEWHENYRWSRAWTSVSIDELFEKGADNEDVEQ